LSIGNISLTGNVSGAPSGIAAYDPQATAAAVRDEVLRLMRRNINGGLG
jgi:hypothetical protein